MADPLCFVLMPFGRKPDAAGRLVDFDAVYRELIAPAIAFEELPAQLPAILDPQSDVICRLIRYPAAAEPH